MNPIILTKGEVHMITQMLGAGVRGATDSRQALITKILTQSNASSCKHDSVIINKG